MFRRCSKLPAGWLPEKSYRSIGTSDPRESNEWWWSNDASKHLGPSDAWGPNRLCKALLLAVDFSHIKPEQSWDQPLGPVRQRLEPGMHLEFQIEGRCFETFSSVRKCLAQVYHTALWCYLQVLLRSYLVSLQRNGFLSCAQASQRTRCASIDRDLFVGTKQPWLHKHVEIGPLQCKCLYLDRNWELQCQVGWNM